MKHNQNNFASDAATDEPASLRNDRPHGSGGSPHDSRPRPPDDGDGLISDRLERYVPVATDALGRRRRKDGFTPERQCIFLDALSRCGVAAEAARAAGISRDTAYELCNRAGGRAFALAWDAAVLISRRRMSDELQSRALNGVVDRIYRNGELWGERHRHDNRLAMAVLTRLDRQAEGLGEGAATARAIAQEWDQFLDIVRDGGEGAEDFLAARAQDIVMPEWDAPAEIHPEESRRKAAWDLDRSADALGRVGAYRRYGGGLSGEGDVSGLDPEAMESWTQSQWTRAGYCGLLDRLGSEKWPEAVRLAAAEVTDGTCRTCQDIDDGDAPPDGPDPDPEAIPGLARACDEYRRRFPPEAPPLVGGEFSVWDDPEQGWVTNFPPPEGYEGFESGDWLTDNAYFRNLSPAEQAVQDDRLKCDSDAVAAVAAEGIAAGTAARDRAFGFAGGYGGRSAEQAAGALVAGPVDQSAESAHTPPDHSSEGGSG